MSRKLSVGIVGLPNVGKSTLFNAITQAGIPAENYPFCTIDPNVGIASVPDKRLDVLAGISETEKVVPAVIEFVDIAGLVKGASKGEGLGNQFLSNIRSTSVIAHVVRCFESTDITHVFGDVDPIRDIDIINTELILSDLEAVEKMIQTISKRTKTGDKEQLRKCELLSSIRDLLAESKPARLFECSDEDAELLSEFEFITSKKVIYVANVSEDGLAEPDNQWVAALKEHAEKTGDDVIVVSAHFEYELTQLDPEERQDYLEEYGLAESGLDLLAKSCFNLLGLHTYLTTGVKETRAWTIRKGMTAPEAAGVIHTDFEKGFIRANVVSYDEFVSCNGLKGAKEKGVLRQEGKDYVVKDGDVVEFLFNV